MYAPCLHMVAPALLAASAPPLVSTAGLHAFCVLQAARLPLFWPLPATQLA